MAESKTMLRRLLPADYPSVILSTSSKSQESGAVSGSIGLPIFTMKEAMIWIELFERKSFTTYSSNENWKHDETKSFFKRKFTCNHQTTGEANGKLTCEAYIEFTIKDSKENMTTLDCYLQDHPAQVTIDFCHNHKIGMENAPPSEKLTAIFRAYFTKGHSPLTALFCQKCDLHSFYDADFYNVISQESVYPSINWCYQEYEKLFKQKYVKPSDIELIQKLKASIEDYNVKYAQKCAVLMDNPLVLSICTPLMKQVFNSGFADDRIIVRTLSGSNAGQKCPNLVVFLGSTPMGPFPFGMVFTLSQNQNVICDGIKALFETLGNVSYNPKMIIVDQYCPITDGLKNIFPLSEIMFNKIQILQLIWRSLRLAHDDYKDFHATYNSFLLALNSKSSKDFENNADKLNINAETYSKMYDLVQVFQTRANRNIDAGYELNIDYMDAGMLMLQDVCIKYGNIFNILQTFDFVTENYMHHYERKLGKIVQGDSQGFFKTNFYASPDETANFTCRKITDCEFVVSSLKTDFFINCELHTCTCQVMEFGRSCIHQYFAEKLVESIPESYNTLAIDTLHAFQTILSYKFQYYLHDVGGISNGTYEDSAAFKELGSIIRHRDNGNSIMNSSCMGLVDSPKLEESLFCLETTDFEYQTCDVDLYGENAYESEKLKNIENMEKGDAATEIGEFPEFEQLRTSNEIEDFSSKTVEALGSEGNQITTLQSSGTDCNFEEGLHLLEESHIETDPNSLIKHHKNNKDLEIDYNINTTYDLYKVFNNENELKAASYKPSNKISSKPKCYINKKTANLKRVGNGYQYGPDGSSNGLASKLVKKLLNEVYSNNYQPKIREFTFEPIKNFDSPDKTTRFDLTTDKQELTLSDPELSFLLKNPQVNIFLDLENCSNHSANAAPIITSSNESMQSSTVIDLIFDEPSKRVTRSRRTQTKDKKSVSSDMKEDKNAQESRPKQLVKSTTKAIGKLGEQPVQNKLSISENCNKSVSPEVPRANGPKPKERSQRKTKKSDKRRVKNKHEESKSDNKSILSQDTANKEEVTTKELRKPTLINKLEMSENCDKSIASNPPAKKPPGRLRKTNKKSSELSLSNKIKLSEDGNKSVQTQDAASMKEARKSVNGLKEPIPLNKCIIREKCDKPIASNPPARKPRERLRKIKNKSAKLPLNNKIKLSEDGNKSVQTQDAASMKEARKSVNGLKEPIPLNKCIIREKCDKPIASNPPAKKPRERPRKIKNKSAKLPLNNKIKVSEECSKPVLSQEAVNMKRPRTVVGELQKDSEKCHKTIFANSTKEMDRKLDQLPLKKTLNEQSDKSKNLQATAKRPIKRPREIIEKSENTLESSSLNNSSYQDDECSPVKRPRGRADQFKRHPNINSDIKSMNLSPDNSKNLQESSGSIEPETYPRRTQRKLTERLQVNSKRRVRIKTNLNSPRESLKNICRTRKSSTVIENFRSHPKKTLSGGNLNTPCLGQNETTLKVGKAQRSGSSGVSTIMSEDPDIPLNRRILQVELETLIFDKDKFQYSKRGTAFKSSCSRFSDDLLHIPNNGIAESIQNETRKKNARKVKTVSSIRKKC